MTSAQFRRRRQKLFGSQHQAAVALGVTQGAVTHWECGRRPVPEIVVKFLECWERIVELEEVINKFNPSLI